MVTGVSMDVTGVNMDSEQMRNVWGALLTDGDLSPLGLPTVNGRVDLRGIRAPTPELVRSFRIGGLQVREMANTVVVENVRWRGIDMSKAVLPSLRFFDVALDDCVFDRADCRGWRAWRSCFTSSSFVRADLRDFSMGAVEGRRNVFQSVDFSHADLRGSGHGSAHFARCNFANAKLAKVNFLGDVFEDCRFAGVVREVEFARTDFRVDGLHPAPGEVIPPNEMRRVDMRDAKLRWVTFSDLDLDDALLPVDSEHIVVEQAPRVLAAVHRRFAESASEAESKWAPVFETMLRHVGRGYRTVIHREDLRELGGDDTLRVFLEVMEQVLAKPQN